GEMIAKDDGDEFLHRLWRRRMPGRPVTRLCQREPIKTEGRQGQQIGELSAGRKRRAGIEFNRDAAVKLRQVELDGLRAVRDIGHTQNRLVAVLAKISEDLAVLREQTGECAASECRMPAGGPPPAARPIE